MAPPTANSPTTGRRRLALAAAFIAWGFFLALCFFDASLLDPRSIAWLMEHDAATSYLGWHFYRFEAWHWPPGRTFDYGMGLGSAIAFTDSVPLLAMGLKPLSPWLPEVFQYHGLWMVACFALQAGFAWLLAGTFARTLVERLAFTLLVGVSPIMIDRAIGHYALMGHWTVLAALWLYVAPPGARATAAWAAIVSATALVHPYLLIMVGAVWFATLLRRVLADRDLDWKQALVHALVVCGALLATLWAEGYFTIRTDALSGGATYYGRYAANLNSFWNPLWGSRFLPNLPLVGEQGNIESFNYLGAGGLALVAAGVVAFAVRRPARWTRHWPIVGAAIVLWMVALTHQVGWGDRLLFTLPLSDTMLEKASMVRGSGRLAWVMYYAMLAAAAACLARATQPAVGAALLVAAVALQLADLEPRYRGLRGYFHDRFVVKALERPQELRDPFWAKAADHYHHLAMVPVVHIPPGYEKFATLAALHHMTFNTGYFSRVDAAAYGAANARAVAQLTSGTLDPGTLYVLWDKAAEIPVHRDPRVMDTVIEGVRVIAPGWSPHTPADRTAPSAPR